MQTAKIYEKTQILVEALFMRFKTFWSKAEQDTAPKKKRAYEDDMAIPRANYRSQYGGYNPSWLRGAILILALVFMFFFQGCKSKQVIVERDRVVYVTKDSIVHRDSTVYVPVEAYKDYSRLTDTLILETSLAKAKAWADTSEWILNGIIENKQAVQYKYIEVERIVTNDSIVEREKPVPYEVEVVKTRIPTWAWLCLVWTVLTLLSIAWSIYRRLKP